MKNFTKKSILQKTIIAIIIALLLSNFIVPTYSHAARDVGGILLDPISDFLCSIGDVVINLLQKCMTGDWGSNGFSLFKGGFLVESTEFFGSSEYADYKTSEKGEEIDPNHEEEGFNKTLITGDTQAYYFPIATYSPEQIFAGKVPGLDINFINPDTDMDGDGKEDKDSKGNYLSSAKQLQPAISKWYVALRNLTIVGLLCVLVYVAIRIIISSTAGDKAKYKQMLMDWLVALCLVFFLHYIMSFTLTLTQSICETINGEGEDSVIITVTGQSESFKTNLLGAARFKTQYYDAGQKLAYLIMYMALVIYTVMFTWFYLKRLLMMAFLTLIAPVVALTYPIDKMNDGKSQAFDSWLKEYVFNALIQPFHLIIYTVFVGTAMDLASTNIIYTIAALGFILPAEKILRKFFGFEKAGAGTLGALGAIAATNAVSKFANGGGGKKPISGPKNEEKENKNDSDKSQIYQKKNGINGIDLDSSGRDKEEKDNKPTDNSSNNSNDNNHDRTQQLAEEFGEEQKNEMNQEQNNTSNNIDNQQQQNGEDSTINSNSNNNDDKPLPGPLRGINNIVSSHGGGKRIALKGAKTLGRAAKFTARTAFSTAGMAFGAAAGLASGQGIAGVVAGATTGRAAGRRLGNMAANLPENVVGGAVRVGSGIRRTVRREIDTFNGNTKLQDKDSARKFKNSEATEQYIRDRWTAEHDGAAPTSKQFKAEKESIGKYVDEGITDMNTIYKAKKIAKDYDISDEQVAKIMALEKDRNINADDLRKKDHYESRKADLAQEFAAKRKDMRPEEAEANAEYVLNVIKAKNGQAHNLDKIVKKRKK